MLHMCVDVTLRPLEILIVYGFRANHLSMTLMPSIINIEVTPMSAIA
jgi:hypothetical protein